MNSCYLHIVLSESMSSIKLQHEAHRGIQRECFLSGLEMNATTEPACICVQPRALIISDAWREVDRLVKF